LKTEGRAILHRVARKSGRLALLGAKRAYQGLNPEAERGVAFVAGVQRSGTNMVMHVLERHFGTEVFHETDPRAFRDYEMRPLPVIRRLVRDSRADLVVVKALMEGERLRGLLDAVPGSRAVWVVRRWEDTVNSQMASWRGKPRVIRALAAGDPAAGWPARGMSRETRDILARFSHPELNEATAWALFWYLRNILFFEQALDADPRVRALGYEPMVTDPMTGFSPLFDHFGLGLRPWHVAQVEGGAVGRRPAPPVDSGVRELCDSLQSRFASLQANGAVVQPQDLETA